jgi:hypothetical protein
MFKCEYCEKEYSTKSNLNHHKKTSKKCLSLRDTVENINFLKCKKCDFQTTLKNTLDRHKCKSSEVHKRKILELENKNVLNSYKTKILELESKSKNDERKILELELKLEKSIYNEMNLQIKIESYESKMFTLASKPTSVNTKTTNIQNLVIADWRQDTISEKVQSDFTLGHLEDGIKGVARFTDEHIIRDTEGKRSLICSDQSRMIFKYKDTEGVIQKDVRATKLKNAIKEPIIKKSQEMFTQETCRLFDVISSDTDASNTWVTNAKIDNLRDNFLQVKRIDDNSDIYAKELVLLVN